MSGTDKKTNKPHEETKPAPIANSADILQGLPVDYELTDTDNAEKMYSIQNVVLVGPDTGAESQKKGRGAGVIEP